MSATFSVVTLCFRTICNVDFSLDATFVVAKPTIRKMRLIRVQTPNHDVLSFLGVAWGFIADLGDQFDSQSVQWKWDSIQTAKPYVQISAAKSSGASWDRLASLSRPCCN